jgi:hypothetical protein
LEPYREQITTWLRDEHLQITRVHELLGQRGLHITYSSLERFAWRLGFRPRHGQRGTTVRIAPTPVLLQQCGPGRLRAGGHVDVVPAV